MKGFPINGKVEPVYGGRGGYDQAPEYPTELGGFLSDVAEEIRLSPVLSDYKKEQKGFVAFVVNGDGRIINIEIMKGFTPEIDQEVIKIIGAMPDWFPAKREGRPVAVRMVYLFR